MKLTIERMAPGVAHAPPITDEQNDVHFVPVDCDPSTHKLAELLVFK